MNRIPLSRVERRRLFYLLVGIFLILSPLLVAYSLGYTFRLSKRTLQQVGGIFLKSDTSGISVFLNNQFVKETSFLPGGALLPNLAPGAHLLRVEKSGYQSWSKTISVEPFLVSEFRDILLVPQPVSAATATPQERILLAEPVSPPKPVGLDSEGNLFLRGTEEILATNVQAYGIAEKGEVFFMDKNGFLAQIETGTGAIRVLGRPGFYLEGNRPLKFVVSPLGDIAVLDSSGGGYLFHKGGGFITVGGDIRNFSFDSEGKKLLAIRERDASVVWVEKNANQPFQAVGTIEPLVRFKSLIRDMAWFFGDDAHAVMRTSEGLFLTEADGRGGRNTVQLIEGPVEAMRTLTKFPNAVFFLQEKVWRKIEL